MFRIALSILALLQFHLGVASGLYEGEPVFHGPGVTGVYPNTDFIFTIPGTGQRPISFRVDNLPNGLKLDNTTGIISGKIAQSGDYTLTVAISNAKGSSKRDLKIIVGDQLALTPPMGWNSWNVFAWDIDEATVMNVADAMASNGMRDLGYQYINIDDFWHADSREADGRPKVDAKKFPHGMKYLSDYVHSKGLKLGIYSCAGDKTCGKKFGSYGFEEIDAKTFAEWGIDLLKYDYCFAPNQRKEAEQRYEAMADALKKSGRSIVFSICEWGGRKPWEWGARVGGQYWRTTGDIYDDWDKSVMDILDKQVGLEKYSGPGHWNDPDMLLVGNYGKGRATGGEKRGCTDTEYQSHMSLWCLLNAPLLTSNDLSKMNEATQFILMNPEILDINQDALGEQAKRVIKDKNIEVFFRRLADGSFAIGVLNKGSIETDYQLPFNALPCGNKTYAIRDVWSHTDLGNLNALQLHLQPHEVKVYKLSVPH
ncbi:MAG: putative Ig domain-containing protein [Chitinophagales bacterium]|nr:putative Ig domain-containing protein [Chitinophagales bacterium]